MNDQKIVRKRPCRETLWRHGKKRRKIAKERSMTSVSYEEQLDPTHDLLMHDPHPIITLDCEKESRCSNNENTMPVECRNDNASNAVTSGSGAFQQNNEIVINTQSVLCCDSSFQFPFNSTVRTAPELHQWSSATSSSSPSPSQHCCRSLSCSNPSTTHFHQEYLNQHEDDEEYCYDQPHDASRRVRNHVNSNGAGGGRHVPGDGGIDPRGRDPNYTDPDEEARNEHDHDLHHDHDSDPDPDGDSDPDPDGDSDPDPDGDPDPDSDSDPDSDHDPDPHNFDPPENPHPQRPPDPPNDPPDGGNGGDNNDEDSDQSDDDNDHVNFDQDALLQDLHFRDNNTLRDALILHCATAIRHNMSYEALLDTLRNENILLQQNQLPSQKKALWRMLQRNSEGIVYHAYCGACQNYIGVKDQLNDHVECLAEDCDWTGTKNTVPAFAYLSFKKAVKSFLSLRGIHQHLQYRENREKLNPNATEAIFDGTCYRNLNLSNRDYSYCANTDGFPISESGTEAWPIFIKINELPPHLRSKYMMLVGLYVGKKPPNMNMFFRPFIEDANVLCERGVTWRPYGPHGEQWRSKFVPTCMFVDAKARPEMLNMVQYNGYFGCNWCDIRGLWAGYMRYPSRLHPPLLVPRPRTHEQMIEDMILASETGDVVRGHKGATELINLLRFHLVNGFVTDDLHPLYEGVIKSLTELLLQVGLVPGAVRLEVVNIIDGRMKTIKTPSCISRKTQLMSFSLREKWKGSQWRNWLLYFAPVCLVDVGIQNRYVNLLRMYSEAVYRLSKRSISPQDLNVARNLLRNFGERYEDYFGLAKMFYNIHISTSHTPDCVEKWGPLWCHSTFLTESANNKLLKRITSPNGAVDQMINRYLIQRLLQRVTQNEDLPQRVITRLNDIMCKKRLSHSREVARGIYMIGNGNHFQLNEDQRHLLRGYDIDGEEAAEYRKVIINSIHYRSVTGENNRSNDSFVVTKDGDFCKLTSLVVIENEDPIAGVFVEMYRVQERLQNCAHIAKIVNPVLQFFPITSIDGPAIKIHMFESVYGVPVANWWEID